jgi:solute carrier family 25 (mitochondrial carnitine/acylcarnitine transporter), member 20/29
VGMTCTLFMLRSRSLVAEQGYSVLFKGLAPVLWRAFPANAACFLGVEVATKALSR